MTRYSLIFVTACLFSALIGCASEPDRPEPVGYFVTHILEDGSKSFQYTLEVGSTGGKSKNGRPGNTSGHLHGSSNRGVSGGVTAGSSRKSSAGGSRQGGYEQFQKINARLEHKLEMELKNSGFCHEGYRELERVVKAPDFFIRGQCKEAASEDDRQRFPNRV